MEMLSRTCRRLRERAPLSIVCYGDSISEVGRSPQWHGGATAPEKNWGQQLGLLLREAYPGQEIRVSNFGIGGQNAYEGLGRLDWLAPFAPDLVLLEFGANDCGYHFLLPEETQLALRTLTEWIRARFEADVAILSPAGDNPRDSFFEHLPETLQAVRAVAEETSAPYIDVRTPLLAAVEQGARWTEFHNGSRDCHPNDAGHRLWAEIVFAALRRELAE